MELKTTNKPLNFTKENQELIDRGLKTCTTRTRIHNDPRVMGVVSMRLGEVKEHLYRGEGYESPEKFQRVWEKIHARAKKEFDPDRIVAVHWGDFSDGHPEIKNTITTNDARDRAVEEVEASKRFDEISCWTSRVIVRGGVPTYLYTFTEGPFESEAVNPTTTEEELVYLYWMAMASWGKPDGKQKI